MRRHGPPTTVRMPPAQREALDRAARRQGVSRSELVRRLLARALAVPIGPAHVTDTGGPHHEVAFALPGVGDGDDQAAKQAVSVRNLATLTGCCSCGARPEVTDELPPAPRPSTEPSFVPSVSEPEPEPSTVATLTRPAPPRVQITARFHHQPGCPASRGAI